MTHRFEGLPGFRIFPFTHHEHGYGYLIQRSGKKDKLFLATLPTNARHTLQMLVASWLFAIRTGDPSIGDDAWPPVRSWPFVFFVDEADTATVQAMGELRGIWARRYPGEECPIFITEMTKAEILELVEDVIAEWGREHPGETYPRSIEEAVQH